MFELYEIVLQGLISTCWREIIEISILIGMGLTIGVISVISSMSLLCLVYMFGSFIIEKIIEFIVDKFRR